MHSAPSKTILVVDDNPATLYTTCRVLKGAGFSTVAAASGRDAIDHARDAPDLVVLDVDLPDINGFEVCRRLRENMATRRTPVIYLSASFVSDLSKVEGLEAGADGYLTHPVEPPVLIATVRAFLRAREAESALRNSEAKFRAMFDNAWQGICLLDEQLNLMEANPALSRLLHVEQSALAGTHLGAHVGHAYASRLGEIQQSLAQSGIFRGTLPLRSADRGEIPVDLTISIYSQTGVSLANFVDATDRVRIELEREQLLESERVARAASDRANRIKDEFLATLSHELRTPLSAIVGWAQLLKFGKCSPREIAQGGEVIERNAKVQARLISDLLDVSRITSGKLGLDLQTLMPADVIRAALESAAASAEAKGISIQLTLDSEAGPIRADSARLQQVIWNLMTNAVKFTQEKGQVHVTLRRGPGCVEVEVRDNGQGIAADFLPFIFDRFRQEDASTRRGHGGLGLGLAIVKQLVDLHGGIVRGESAGVGLGSTFVVILPLAGEGSLRQAGGQPVELSTEESELASGSVALNGARILIAEDDEDTRTLIDRVLIECGAHTMTASNVADAIRLAEVGRPDLLISDIGMPGRDGYDLIHELRRMGLQAATLPAIALTALARTEDRQRALTAGYQLHLKKPVDPNELLRSVHALLRTDLS